MESWQYFLVIAAAALLLLLGIRSAAIKKRKRKERDFTRTLETVLQPRETIKAVCPSHPGHWVLTSRRLLLETKEGFTAIPLAKIKKLQGFDSTGKATTSVPKMATLTIRTDREYTIRNTGEDFAQLASQLKGKVSGRKTKR